MFVDNGSYRLLHALDLIHGCRATRDSPHYDETGPNP